MAYRTISDDEFTQRISLGEAYRILEAFISQYNARGESSTVALLTDVGLVHGGQTADPAQLDDFLRCARQVIALRQQQP
jgi:hypothetical protein